MNQNILKTIQKLKTYKHSGFPILSLYLGFENKKSPNLKQLLSNFHSLVNGQLLTHGESPRLENNVKQVEKYLIEEFDTRGKRSIVFFTGNGLFEVLEFEFYMEPNVYISYSPHLEPMMDKIREHNSYMVLVADHKKAKMFTVHLGEIEEQAEFVDGHVPQNVRANERDFYGRSDIIFRHIEDHLHRHLKLIAEKAEEFAKDKKINFVIIGGHRELFKKIKKHLPRDLRDKVSGEFVTELNIPINSIFLQSKKISESIEQDKVYNQMEQALR